MTGPCSREDLYVHLAAQLDGFASPAARTTERLRAVLSDLREPLARLSDASAVISTSLFRAARLPQLGGAAVVAHHDDRLRHYDVAILVTLPQSGTSSATTPCERCSAWCTPTGRTS